MSSVGYPVGGEELKLSRCSLRVDTAASPSAAPRFGATASTSPWIPPLVVAACFAAFWLLLDSALSRVAPADNIEQLTWVRSLEWGYYKHPPLPTWLLWPLVRLFGLNEWNTYVLGALMTLTAVAMLRSVVAQAWGRQEANLCALAVLCVTYYNGRLYYYNHNVVLLWISAACAWSSWQALRTRKIGWWVVVGALLGIGALTKYQIAITALCTMACWLLARGWRDRVHRQGAALAIMVAMTIFAPHLVWLVESNFPPVHYAMSSSLSAGLGCNERMVQSVTWLSDQLLNRALPAWLMLALTAATQHSHRGRPGTPLAPGHSQAGPSHLQPDGRSFLLVWGVLPLWAITIIGLLAGSDLQLQWGTAFVLFTIPAVMVLTRRVVNWAKTPAALMLLIFAGVQTVLAGESISTSPLGAAPKLLHWRAFDIESLSQAIELPMRKQIGRSPVCVISGPSAVAGALALRMPAHPLVLIDGRMDRSPWVASMSAQPGCALLEVIPSKSRQTDTGFQAIEGPYGQFEWRVSALHSK
ncbi:MAG: hypothetical protein NVS2B4_09580 [Ramlibacter sp.]